MPIVRIPRGAVNDTLDGYRGHRPKRQGCPAGVAGFSSLILSGARPFGVVSAECLQAKWMFRLQLCHLATFRSRNDVRGGADEFRMVGGDAPYEAKIDPSSYPAPFPSAPCPSERRIEPAIHAYGLSRLWFCRGSSAATGSKKP